MFEGYCYNAYPLAGALNYTPKVKTNQWYCIVLAADADSLRFYLDGVRKYACKRSGYQGDNSYDLIIGRHNSTAYPYTVKGKIDEVRLYNRALTPAEVLDYCTYGTTSIASVENEVNDISVSPNPAMDYLTVTYTLSEHSDLYVSIVDIFGKEIYKSNVAATKGVHSQSINVSGFATGNYILKLVTNKTTVNQRFIKK